MNGVMIFEGNKVEVFEFKNRVLFNPRHVAKCLELSDSGLRNYLAEMNENQKVKLKNSDISVTANSLGRKLNNAGENFMTESGVISLITRSTSVKKKEVLNALGFDNVVVLDRFEVSFGKCLINTLKAINVEVETQKLTLDKYRIDFYLPNYNLAIEYDEAHHENNIKKDLQRQTEIEKELGYKFMRLDYKNDDNYNVGLVIREIFSNMEGAI